MSKALDVATFIINHGIETKNLVSNLRVQKLLYLLWVEFFKETGEALFEDDFYAWSLGPVVPEVYYAYCTWSGLPIRSTHTKNPISENAALSSVLSGFIEQFVPLTTAKLVDLSHDKAKSWFKTFQNGEGNKQIIPFEDIRLLDCK